MLDGRHGAPGSWTRLFRIAEAEHYGWLGEIAGLQASLTAAEQKLDTMRHHEPRHSRLPDIGWPRLTGTGIALWFQDGGPRKVMIAVASSGLVSAVK
jgi:hypothetical protein